MNPQSNETGMQLPPPMEQAPDSGQGRVSTNEQAPASAERSIGTGQGQPPQAAMPPASIPAAYQPQVTPAADSQSATAGTGSPTDDGDLIEKEWVSKAKQIVERTRDDPYKQSEELTLVKVDYMKKRYGKSLKLSS